MNKDISVICCVYNTVEVKLLEALESVMHQTADNFEFIIVNDGCDSDHEFFLKRFKERWHVERPDCPISIIHTSDKNENKGLATARNVGIAYAAGDWIYFIDSDDIMWNKTLETMWTELNKQEDKDLIDIVLGHTCRGSSIGQAKQYFETNRSVISSSYIFDKYLALMKICKYIEAPTENGYFVDKDEMIYNATWNKLYRKEKIFFGNYPGRFYEGHPHEDNYFTHQIYWNMRLGLCIPNTTYFYRFNGNFAGNNLYKNQEIGYANEMRYEFLHKKVNSEIDNSTSFVFSKKVPFWKEYGQKVVKDDNEKLKLITANQRATIIYTYWRIYCETQDKKYINIALNWLKENEEELKLVRHSYIERVVRKICYGRSDKSGVSNNV